MVHKIIELTEEFILPNIQYLYSECQKLENTEEVFQNTINDIQKYPDDYFEEKVRELDSNLFVFVSVYLKDAYQRYKATELLETQIMVDKKNFLRNLLINVGKIFAKSGYDNLQKAHKKGVKRTLINMISDDIYNNFLKVEPREENKEENMIGGEINKLYELGNLENNLENLLQGLRNMDNYTSEDDDDLSDIRIDNIEIESPEQFGGGIPSFKEDSVMHHFERNENHVTKPPEIIRGNVVAHSLNEVLGTPQRSIFNSMNEDGTSKIEEL